MAGLIEKMAGKTVRWSHILERRPVIHKNCISGVRGTKMAPFLNVLYLVEGFRNRFLLLGVAGAENPPSFHLSNKYKLMLKGKSS